MIYFGTKNVLVCAGQMLYLRKGSFRSITVILTLNTSVKASNVSSTGGSLGDKGIRKYLQLNTYRLLPIFGKRAVCFRDLSNMRVKTNIYFV